jgi:hypothetical protein
MAEHASDYTHGHMDVHQNQASFETFIKLTKWGSLAVAVTVLGATLWFCTDAGPLGGLIPAVVLLALGVFFLREKPGSAGAH